MLKPPPFTFTNESIGIVWEGKSHTVQKSSPHFIGLRKAILEERWDDIPNYLTVAKSLNSWAQGKFTFVEHSNTFSYEGREVPREINNRIVQMATTGADPTPMLRFYERLQKNPSWRSVEQLYKFLTHSGIPITKDGCFLAYKGVNADYTDCHSGTVSNKPGTINKMPRNQISDDPNHACHVGFHVGAKMHASGYGKRMLVCKVDPEHVVCVPYDAGQQKMRVCEYKVLGHLGEGLPDTIFEDEEDLTALPETPAQSDPADEDDDAFNGESEEDIEEGPEEEDGIENDESSEEIEPEDEEEAGELKGDLVGDLTRVAAQAIKTEEEEEAKTAGNLAIPKKYAKRAFLPLEELMKLTLDDLRELATYGLKIIGASKVPGGKVALAAKIMEVRGGGRDKK